MPCNRRQKLIISHCSFIRVEIYFNNPSQQCQPSRIFLFAKILLLIVAQFKKVDRMAAFYSTLHAPLHLYGSSNRLRSLSDPFNVYILHKLIMKVVDAGLSHLSWLHSVGSLQRGILCKFDQIRPHRTFFSFFDLFAASKKALRFFQFGLLSFLHNFSNCWWWVTLVATPAYFSVYRGFDVSICRCRGCSLIPYSRRHRCFWLDTMRWSRQTGTTYYANLSPACDLIKSSEGWCARVACYIYILYTRPSIVFKKQQ